MNREAVWHAFGKAVRSLGFFETGLLISLTGACTCTKLNYEVMPKAKDIF